MEEPIPFNLHLSFKLKGGPTKAFTDWVSFGSLYDKFASTFSLKGKKKEGISGIVIAVLLGFFMEQRVKALSWKPLIKAKENCPSLSIFAQTELCNYFHSK